MSDDITERIARETIENCAKQEVNDISLALATFIVKCVSLDSESIRGNRHLQEKQARDITDLATETICGMYSAQLETVKMQLAVSVAKEHSKQKSIREQKNHQFKTGKLLEEILANANESLVYSDIVLFILHETRLLEKQNTLVEKETTSALESVIPRNYIKSFISQADKEKKNQLFDLWKIVWGIRLFNKFTNKGGTGIGNFDERILHDVQKIQKECGSELTELEKLIKSYTTVIQSDFTEDLEKLSILRTELVNRTQYYNFLIQFKASQDEWWPIHEAYAHTATDTPPFSSQQNNALDIESHVRELSQTFHSRVDEIQITVEKSMTVSKSIIYPMFIVLTETWQQFQEYITSTQQIKQTHQALRQYRHSFKAILTVEDIDTAKEFEAESKREIDELGEDVATRSPGEEGEEEQQQQPRESAFPVPIDIDDIPAQVELNSYDIVAIVQDNMPSPVEYQSGYIQYNGRYYGFSSAATKHAFKENPMRYLSALINSIKKNPDMMHLLDVQRMLPMALLLSTKGLKKVEMVSMDVQTETHFVESHIDHHYEFSEWKLRQKALRIADLRNKRTHSTQTHESRFRKEQQTQVWAPKNTGTQTRMDKGTNPIKHLRYIRGLRGDPDSKMNIVNMTFEHP